MDAEVRSSGRPTYLIVVVAFAALLGVQGLWSFVVRPEPYPSVRMPSFGLAASKAGTMPTTLARVEAVGPDGTTRSVSVTELMDQFRFSTARPSFDHVFRDADPSTLDPEVRTWLRARIETTLDGFRATEVRLCWQRADVRVTDASVASEPCTWKSITL